MLRRSACSDCAGNPDHVAPAAPTRPGDRHPAELDGHVTGRAGPCQAVGPAILPPAAVGSKPGDVHRYSVYPAIPECTGDVKAHVRPSRHHSDSGIVRADRERPCDEYTGRNDPRRDQRDQPISASHSRIMAAGCHSRYRRRLYRNPTPARAPDPGQSFSNGTWVSGWSEVAPSSCRSDDCSSM
jgi:hypothetical protein